MPEELMTVSSTEIFIALFMSLTLLLLGLACLFWPQTIQGYAMKHNARWLVGRRPFLDWMNTPKYLKYLRVVGGIILSVAIILTIIFMKKWFESWFI
jgi:nitric oxide reductase large subunit